MPITEKFMKKIAKDVGVSIDELTTSGLLAFLREKKRKIMLEMIEILDRYAITSSTELEKKIKDGSIAEHPTWEDLILLENLESAIALIDEDIKALQKSP